MTAVRTESEVVVVEAVSLTDSGRFLTERKVSGTGVVVFNAVVDALCLYLVEHSLKLADYRHIAINVYKVLLRIDSLFVFDCKIVLANGNIVESDKTAIKRSVGIYILTLRHDFNLSFPADLLVAIFPPPQGSIAFIMFLFMP